MYEAIGIEITKYIMNCLSSIPISSNSFKNRLYFLSYAEYTNTNQFTLFEATLKYLLFGLDYVL